MKKLLSLFLIFFPILRGVTAQNIYESIGKKADILTLSEGKYQEIFTNDTLVRIGSVLFNRVTNEVVEFVTKKDSNSLAEADVASRFLSVDPIGREYPELTPYQFASNTPIVAVDLDGLEAAVVTYSYRVTAMIVTGSYSGGAVIDAHGNVKAFTHWTIGPAVGAFAGGGATVGIFPAAKADELMGWGGNFGANAGLPGVSFGIDLNVSPQFGQNDFRLGVSGGIKPGSFGPGGAEIHVDIGKATPFLEFNIYDVTKEQIDKLSETFGLTVQQALNYLEYLKAASLPLKALLDETKTNKKESKPSVDTKSKTKSETSQSANKTKDDTKNKESKTNENKKSKTKKAESKKA